MVFYEKLSVFHNKGKIRALRLRGGVVSPVLTLYDSPVRLGCQLRILGMVLDDRVLHFPHILLLKMRCRYTLYLVRHHSFTTWGAGGGSNITFLAMIRSKLNYAAAVYGQAFHFYLGLLDPIQNESLELTTGDF